MSIPRTRMVNEAYTPSDNEEYLLDVLKEGRATPLYFKERTGLNDQQINYGLNQLMAAGWVERVTKGLYELVVDPREEE